MKTVSEKIDERILRLLGLQDVFDIDYDTYMTLLKEAIVTGSNKLPEEELSILANERKRVRGKKGRFKPKKQNEKVDKISTQKFLKQASKTSILAIRTSKTEIQKQDLTGIGKPLESISKTLAALLKFSKKTNEEERKDKESQKRTKREESLEGFKKGISAISSAAKKMLSPFQSIIDRIWRFIFFTLLGRAFTQLMNWLGDSKNKKKIEVLGRFLKDWWPTLLGAAVLFFTPFGKFVRSTLKLVGFFTGRLVKAIPRIARAVAGLGRFAVAHPLLSIGATTAAATFGAEMWRQGEENKRIESESRRREVKPETVKVELEEAKRSPFVIFGEAMQNIGGFAKGGFVQSLSNGYNGIDSNTGQKVSGFGPDTQMIVAQPGEVVMNKKAVDAIGADNLLALNRQYGGPGANKPKMGKLYNTGGIVGYQGGGKVQGTKRENNNGGWWQTLGKIGSGVLSAVSRPLQAIRSKGLGGTVRRGYHGTSPEAARSIRQANRYRNWKAMGLGFKPGSWQNIYLSRSAFMTPERAVAERFATSVSSPGRGIFERGFGRGVRGAGEIIDVAAPVGSGSFLRLPGFSEQLVRPDTLTKGMRMMEKINAGQYSRSAKARQLLTTGQTTSSLRGARGLGKLAGRFAPGANIALGAADTAYRLSQGDIPGSGLSLLSMVPGPLGWAALASQLGYDAFANPQRKQGGGLIERKATELVDREMPNTIRDYYEQLQNGFIQPMSPEETEKSIEEQKKLKIRKLIRDYQLYQNIPHKTGGGLIKENTGRNIPGATADRQLVAAQPGEYVITTGTVNKLGKEFFDYIVGSTDSNSNAAKLGYRTKNVPKITPLSMGGIDNIMTLPPITQGLSGGVSNNGAAGSKAPVFSTTSPSGGSERSVVLNLYGIVG